MSYRRFFLIRLAQALFAAWLVATLVFFMFFVVLPRPERNLVGGNQATPAMIQRATSELDLRAPLHERYASFMWRLFAHQTAGTSPSEIGDPNGQAGAGLHPDSGAVARRAIPPTLSLVVLTLAFSLGVGGVAGFALARDPGGGSMAFRSTSRSG